MNLPEISVTIVVLVITCLVSLRAFEDRSLKYRLSYSPYDVANRKQWYKAFTHMFVHQDFMHLFFNMFVLYEFGRLVELYFFVPIMGAKGYYFYFLLYFGGGFAATFPALLKHGNNPNYLSLGASGAVSSVLFSAITLMPFEKLRLFLFIPMYCALFGVLYIAYEMYMNRRGGTKIAHDAHLWGAVYGVIFTLAINEKFRMISFSAFKEFFS